MSKGREAVGRSPAAAHPGRDESAAPSNGEVVMPLPGVAPAGSAPAVRVRRGLTPFKIGVAGVATLAFVGLVAMLFAASVRAVPGNSDGATVILEGQAIGAGHLTLHGWFLSFDSFWGSDALVYAVAVLFTGVRAALLNVVPALLGALVVVVGVHLARDDRRAAPAWAGAVTVLALLGLPSYALSVFFLQGPLHVGTALWCLVAFALLQRPEVRWRWAVAVVLLAAAADGDLQAIAFGIAPVLVGGLLAMARRRDWRAGFGAVSAVAASVALAFVVREVAKVIGTFVVNKSNPIATHTQMGANISLAFEYSAKMLGFGSAGFGSGGMPGVLAGVHVVGVVLVAAGVLVALVDLVRGAATGSSRGEDARNRWRLDDVLVLAVLADLAVFVVLTPATNVSYARYLTAAVVFAVVLAGRLVARIVAALPSGWPARLATTAGVAAAACFAAGFGYNLAQPVKQQPAAQLGQYLLSHHLRVGIGDYWSSSIVTVETHEDVQVRPVTALPAGRIVSYTRNSSRTWYSGKSFQFLVFNAALPFGDVDAATARATFGPPAHTYATDGYLVLVWSHRITVASGTS
ncbi:MAG: hypothetical protein JWO62_344 [Acidimicrobiaceae bacterium]|jgi:hypothetical protein|nr:hypothetical protein [Acidimicrobiaceae bacterium]